MSNALFLYDNALQGSMSYFGGGSSVQNMAYAPLAQRWVSPGLSAPNCTVTFSVPGNPTVAAFVLAHHNLTLAAQVRIQADNAGTFAAPVYDSGWLNAFAAGVTDASRAGQRQHFWHVLASATSAAYWRLQITDAANPDGYVAVGRMGLMRGVWQPSINMAAGASLGWENRQEVQEALSGAEWFVDKEARKVVRFSIEHLPTAEAFDNPFTMGRLASTYRRELLFVYDPADGLQSQRRLIWGRLRQLGALEEPFFNAHTASFEVSELLP